MSAKLRKKETAVWPLAVLILFVGYALRVYRIEAQPLSGDEAYSVLVWTRNSIGYLLSTIALATTEPHPPLALISFNLWARVAGDSILALRMLSVLESLVTIAATYQIARWLGGRRAALIAALFCALNPFQLWYAQFARNYSMWMAGSALTVFLLLRAWKRPRNIAGWIPYVLAAVFTAYVFYLEAFVLVAHNLYALTKIRQRPEHLRTWVIVQVSIGAALAPWYLRPELRVNSQDYEPNAGPANLLWAIQSFLVGDTLPPLLQNPLIADPAHSLGIASLVSVLLVVAALFVLWKTVSRDTFFLLLPYGITPLAILAGLAALTGRGYFHPRYIAANSVPLILIAALGIAGIGRLSGLAARSRQLLSLGAAGIIVGLSGIGLWNYHFNPAFARGPDWAAVMETLNAQTGPNDLILYNFPDPAFNYYFDTIYTGPAHKTVMPKSQDISYPELADQLSALTADYDYIWFVPEQSASWDPDQNVARWLAQEKQPLSEQWIGATRLYQYTAWEPSAGQMTHELTATFVGVAHLEGYRLTPSSGAWQPGTPTTVELFWRPLGQTAESLKVFVHLLGPAKADGSVLWTQDDRFPQGGRISTQGWPPGELVRDVYTLTLPPDAPPGQYIVVAGFYDPDTGERIPVDSPQGTDSVDYAGVLTFVLP